MNMLSLISMWRCLVVAGYRNLAFRKGRVGKKKKKKKKGQGWRCKYGSREHTDDI